MHVLLCLLQDWSSPGIEGRLCAPLLSGAVFKVFILLITVASCWLWCQFQALQADIFWCSLLSPSCGLIHMFPCGWAVLLPHYSEGTADRPWPPRRNPSSLNCLGLHPDSLLRLLVTIPCHSQTIATATQWLPRHLNTCFVFDFCPSISQNGLTSACCPPLANPLIFLAGRAHVLEKNRSGTVI